LDRPHIVRRVDAGRLELSGNDRWGSPLQEMVATTLAKNLAERLPESEFFTEGGAISATPDVTLEVELQRFERTSAGKVELVAQVALRFPGDEKRSHLHRYEFDEPTEHGGTRALVAQMSALLARLADSIASALLSNHAAHTPADSTSEE
jgi:uncharacterized lipoprotein YmbA